TTFAALDTPLFCIAADGRGHLYVGDTSRLVSKINREGMVSSLDPFLFLNNNEDISTVFPPLPMVVSLAFDNVGNMYFADQANRRIGVVAAYRTIKSTSAASFSGLALASDSIVAAFGNALATSIRAAAETPLPTSLEGLTVSVKDSFGIERLAPLFF